MQKEESIYTQLNTDLIKKKESLIEQKESIISQNFPVGHRDIKWKFNKYNPEEERFIISIEIKDLKIGGYISAPKIKAKEYYYNPDLLIAKATISLDDSGGIVPNSFSLHGPEGDKFQTNKLSKSYKFIKLTIDSGYNKKEVQLAEIEFFQGDIKIPVSMEAYSSEYHDKRWSHKKIIDGKPKTSWANANSHDNKYPHWFILTPTDNDTCFINMVRLYTGTQSNHKYRLSSFSIYGSNNKREWFHLLTGNLDKNSTNKWETFYINPKGYIKKEIVGLQFLRKHTLKRRKIIGTWEGRGCQSSGSCWTIKIHILPLKSNDVIEGTISYPSLNCTARLEFVRWENSTAVFRERYIKRGNCVDNGWLYLTPKDNMKLDYIWAWPNGKKDAHTEVALVE